MEKYSQLLRFNSSSCKDNKELISLEEYVSRLKDNQKEIYFAFGSSRDAIDLDPHLEVFKRKGLEVLYMYDPIDEFVVTSIRKFKDYDFKSVDSVELEKIEKLKDEKETETKVEELSKDDNKHFDSLLAKMKTILGDRVVDVKESKRLFDSPSCLVNPDSSMSSSMLKMMRLANQDMGQQKKIFEVNKDHHLVRNLLAIFKADSNDDYINNVTEQLYESALLIEGNLDDPHKLVNRLNKMMEQSSEWYKEVKKL